jgi:DNA transposition AAA+ family ATPase
MSDDDLIKRLEHDAQVRRERIPMKVTKLQATEVAAALQDLRDVKKLTQTDLAKMLGVGPAKLNQFLLGKYRGQKGTDELVNKGVQLLESIARKEGHPRGNAYVETSVAKAIGALIVQTEALSDEEGKIGLVIGDGGHGKSVCMRQYVRANRNSFYVELDDAMTPTTMFAAIAEKADIDSAGSLASVTKRIIEGLFYRHVIILLDEASGLKVKQLNQLRQILAVKARCPLILAGNQDLHKTVMQRKERPGCESLDQFTSRLSYIVNLDRQASQGDSGLYTAADVRSLYQYGGIRLTGDAVKLLRDICKSPRTGRLRTCSHVITTLHTSRKCRRQGFIDSAAIVSAIEQLGLPVRVWLPVETREITKVPQHSAAAKAG